MRLAHVKAPITAEHNNRRLIDQFPNEPAERPTPLF